MTWWTALIPVTAGAVNVLTQLLFYRVTGRGRLLRSVYVGFATGFVVATAASALTGRSGMRPLDAAAVGLLNMATYAALGYGYFHFINLGETARRVRLLWEFADAGGALSDEEILRRYNADEIVRVRLGRLLRNGQIVERDGRYVIGRPTMLRMVRTLMLTKRLLLGRTGERDEGTP